MSNKNDCQNRREAVTALVLGELETPAADEIKNHIDTCRNCRLLYQALTEEEETVMSAFKAIDDRGKAIEDSLVAQLNKNSRAHDDVSAGQGESQAEKSAITQPNIWRIISRSPIATFAAAVLIAGVAFLGGRLSMPRTLPPSKDDAPPVVAEADGVNVPNELIAWLEAACLFKQLGMEDRMARAVERAGRLLPADTFIADDQILRVFAAGSIGNQTERVEPMGILGPHPSAESINQILAQSFGD